MSRIAEWFRVVTGEDVRIAKLRVELAQAQERAKRGRVARREVREQLKGPIHGLVQTIRGMCSDELPHEEIDAKLTELDDLVHDAAVIVAPTTLEIMAGLASIADAHPRYVPPSRGSQPTS